MAAALAAGTALVATQAGLASAASTGSTTPVVTAAGGGSPDGYSVVGAITPDARWLVYSSNATDLFETPSSNNTKLVVRDRATGVNRLVMDAPPGAVDQGERIYARPGGISDDGRFIAFDTPDDPADPSTTLAHAEVWVFDQQSGAFTEASLAANGAEANGDSATVGLSGDGTKVLFRSSATNLAANVPQGESLYLRDLTAGTTTLVSTDPSGQPDTTYGISGAVSFDGGLVAYSDFHAVYVRHTATGAVETVSIAPNGSPAPSAGFWVAMSEDGNRVLFTMATGSKSAAFVRDRAASTTTPVGVLADGSQFSAYQLALSADGTTAALSGQGLTGTTDLYLSSATTGTSRLASVTDGGESVDAYEFAVPNGGAQVFFSSNLSHLGALAGQPATNRVVYLHDFDGTPGSACSSGGVQQGTLSGAVYDTAGSQNASCTVLVPNGL